MICVSTMAIGQCDDFGEGCSLNSVQCLWYMTNPMAYCAPDRDHQKSCPVAVINVVRVCRW